MNTQFQELIPHDFGDNSRVWIYQSNRPFTAPESLQLNERLKEFAHQWLSHGEQVKAFSHLFFDHFIILMADEADVAVGGCSTDSSTRFIKGLEKDFGVHLFDRQTMAFIIKERIQLFPLNIVNKAISKEIIGPETPYFNNTILTRKELMNRWIIPMGESWLSMRIPHYD